MVCAADLPDHLGAVSKQAAHIFVGSMLEFARIWQRLPLSVGSATVDEVSVHKPLGPEVILQQELELLRGCQGPQLVPLSSILIRVPITYTKRTLAKEEMDRIKLLRAQVVKALTAVAHVSALQVHSKLSPNVPVVFNFELRCVDDDEWFSYVGSKMLLPQAAVA
jgi:hypothetical protein